MNGLPLRPSTNALWKIRHVEMPFAGDLQSPAGGWIRTGGDAPQMAIEESNLCDTSESALA